MDNEQDMEQSADASKEIDFESLGGEEWAHLLAEQPQYADMCDWSKLDGRDWMELLYQQPQFADKCNVPKSQLDSIGIDDLEAEECEPY